MLISHKISVDGPRHKSLTRVLEPTERQNGETFLPAHGISYACRTFHNCEGQFIYLFSWPAPAPARTGQKAFGGESNRRNASKMIKALFRSREDGENPVLRSKTKAKEIYAYCRHFSLRLAFPLCEATGHRSDANYTDDTQLRCVRN